MALITQAGLLPGHEVGRYGIVKKMSLCSLSSVYLANTEDGKQVTIKEYFPRQLASRQLGQVIPVVAHQHRTLFDMGLASFFNEGLTLARISHPNILPIVDFFRANRTAYFVSAFESEYSLQQFINWHTQHESKTSGISGIAESSIRYLMQQVLDALSALHKHRLLHLDLKPLNIYLRPDGKPVLRNIRAAEYFFSHALPAASAQSAIAQSAHSGDPTINNTAAFALSFLNSPYSAPELYQTQSEAGTYTDSYSVGALLYTCMTGTPPPNAQERSAQDVLKQQYAKLGQHYSQQLIHVMRSCLILEPNDRPQHPAEISTALGCAVQ